MSEIAEDLVREHLAKVLLSREFQNSERLCRFLRFTTEALLRGERDQVKEYLIGKEVFDRNADYDPRLDPIVRVEARRLRKKLEDYYAGAGATDSVRIELPKGSYVPEIRSVAAEVLPVPPPVRALSRSRIWIGLAVLALIAAVSVAVVIGRRPAVAEHSIAVMPARWVWPSEDFPAIRHDEDLAERVAANLANRYGAPVISWPSLQRFRGGNVSTRKIASELGIDRMLIVSVRVEADGFRVGAFLIDPKVDRKMRASDKRHVSLQSPSDREAVAAALAADFSAVK